MKVQEDRLWGRLPALLTVTSMTVTNHAPSQCLSFSGCETEVILTLTCWVLWGLKETQFQGWAHCLTHSESSRLVPARLPRPQHLPHIRHSITLVKFKQQLQGGYTSPSNRGKKTKAQRGAMTCRRSQSQKTVRLGVAHRSVHPERQKGDY